MDAPADDKRTLGSLSREAQRAFMQVVVSAEHELARASQRLRESLGGPTDGEGSIAHVFVERARRERDALEQRIESEVLSTLAKVRAPIDREMEAMRGRLERLRTKLEGLRAKRG